MAESIPACIVHAQGNDLALFALKKAVLTHELIFNIVGMGFGASF